jgi:methionine synthase I (cobalamin-dependent)
MARPSLLDVLRQRPLLCDGGMGTQLIARGLGPGECADLWNLTRPDDVREVHRAYRAAGCDLLTTCSFQANTLALAAHGLADQADAINQAAAANARAATDDQAWVLGDIGPSGAFLEPMGEMTVGQLQQVFARQARALLDGGADAFIIETMSDPGEVAAAIVAARSVAPVPIIATYAFERSGDGAFRTMMGTTPSAAVSAAIDAGADVVGANCGTSLGLADYVALAGELVAAAGDVPVIVQPNAGTPVSQDGRMVHPASPADMAALVAPLCDAGVRVIGGCCGTTPAHLHAMAAAM